MVFPDARVELKIDALWTPTTGDVMHEGGGIVHKWGRRAEGSRTDPTTASFDLFNPDGKYAGRNPNSPYYGKLGRNTPVRISIDGANVALVIPPEDNTLASTPDVAALDVVGDIDVRADLTPSAWGGETSSGNWEVMGKYNALSRSWVLSVTDSGCIQFLWSTLGFLTTDEVSTAPVPFGPGQRGAIRATLDVDNGSGGCTVTFYTAPTMAGSWTQLGDPVVRTTGTTAIFASTAQLEVGDLTGLTYSNISREYHSIEVRNGIGGAAVANPVFSAQASGTLTFADAAGRTWTAFNASLTSRRTLAVLEASSWAPRWSAGGLDVTTPIEASGILRRFGQGSKALASAIRRRVPTQDPVAYWPLEEGRDATQATSPIEGVQPLNVSGLSFAADDSCPGSAALPTINAAGILQGPVPAYDGFTSGYLVSLLYSIDNLPASDSPLLAFTTNGTAHGVVIHLTSTGLKAEGYDAAGASLFTQSAPGAVAGAGTWFRLDVSVQQAGLNVDFHVAAVSNDATVTETIFAVAGDVGTVVSIDTAFGALLTGMAVGHLVLFPSSDRSVWASADNGYSGETATERLLRLAAEESVPITIATSPGTITPMGPQRPDKLVDLLAECEAADGGVLSEDPRQAGLSYRSRTTLYSQTPALTLTYSQLVTPVEPVDDDRYVRNDRTVSRQDGSFARATQTTGPLSVQQPPDGVGVYDDSQTINVETDAQLPDIASWWLHLGTVDEARYPQVRILLHKYPALIGAVAALRQGDIVRITDLPSFLPAGPLDLRVEGGENVIRAGEWACTLTFSPGSPWTVAVLDDDELGRVDTDGSVLGVAASSSATTLVVHTTQTEAEAVPLWTQDAADFPVDLRVGGEVVTATAAASLAEDTFTRTVAAGGWGTASDGHTWTLTGGSASDRSVAATYGVVTLPSAPTTVRLQTVAETCRDCEIRAAVAVSATATGGSLVPAILLRYVDASNYYRVRVEFTTAGGITLTLTRVTTVIGSGVSTGLTYTAGSVVEVRVRVIGHRVLARAWTSGNSEPGGWQLDETVTSSTITDGLVGLAASGLTGNTNVSPQLRFHDWRVESPQRITVTRSTNGIVKAQTIGTDIRLATPPILAL